MHQNSAAKTNHPSILAFFPSASPQDIAAQLPPTMRQQSETTITRTNMDSSSAAEDDSPFPTDMDDISDDETVVNGSPDTPITTSRPRPPHQQWPTKDITLKFLFQTTHEVSAREAAGRCLSVLSAIVKINTIYPVKIFDKHGNTMTNFSQDAIPKFKDHLPIVLHKARPNNHQIYNYWTVFKIRTQLPIRDIRQNDVVFHTLQSTNGRLSIHPWDPSADDVISLGFIIGALPRYQTEDHFTALV
jgi:hypothetical protein